MFIGLLDLGHSTIKFVNCGHPPPLLLKKAEGYNSALLSTDGTVIGADQEMKYTESQLEIQPGDLLICYTDGISEARNAAGDEFGLEGVERAAREAVQQNSSMEGIADAIILSARRFAAVPDADDATVMVFRRLP